MFVVVLVFGLALFPATGVREEEGTTASLADGPSFGLFADTLSLSITTFVSLGFGPRSASSRVGELLAAGEALLGALLLAAFVVALAGRYVRRL